MPLASMSNVTWICGTPRGAGGMPSSWKRASDLLSSAMSRSPCRTCTSTNGWLSTAVENTSCLRVGIVVFFGMSAVNTPPAGLHAERQRRHVEQQHFLHGALQDARLQRRADGHDLVGIDALVGLLAEELLDDLLHARHARLPADEDHLVDVLGLQARVLERHLARIERALHQVLDQRLQLAAGEARLQMQWPLRRRPR